MNLNPIVLSIPVFFILIGIEIIYDRITHKNLYRMNDAVSNISCGIFEQITGVFAKVFTVAMYAFVFDHFRLYTIPDRWYWLVLLFIGVDFFYYWAHRMSHEINLFWAGHVVHHQSEEYNLSVALRQGALQKVFTSAFYIPLALAGFKTEWFLLLTAYNTLYQFWIHTEAIRSMGPLEYIFNTPSHHRVHHGRNPKYIDRNHGGSLIIWDKLFGTFQQEEEKAVYGITTPAVCWDPVKAHLRPFKNIWSDFRNVPEWKYRMQLLFRAPGWLPEKYGGYRAPSQVLTETYEKFHTKLNREINVYLLIHFILILGGASFFLFNMNAMDAMQQVMVALLIIFSIMSAGLLFEGNISGRYAEDLRMAVICALALLLFYQEKMSLFLLMLTAALTLSSVLWLHRFYSFSPQKKES